jgi:hypothetical protein
MVDVVDVLDAFEAKRKRQPKVIFEIEELKIGRAFYVRATLSLTRSAKKRIGGGFYVKVPPRYEQPLEPVYGFKSRAEAEAWIEADRTRHRPRRRAKIW